MRRKSEHHGPAVSQQGVTRKVGHEPPLSIVPSRWSVRQHVTVRLRPTRNLDDLRKRVEWLDDHFNNLAAYGTGPTREPLRNNYLRWVRDAEGTARRYLADVPMDQFATNRWRAITEGTVPDHLMWSVVAGDCQAQLDWFAGVIHDLTPPELPTLDLAAKGIWREGQIRAFMSHVAEQKLFASSVAEALASVGIQGFVAHEAIEYSTEWQSEIERALRTTHVFVGLVHAGFSESWWTQQEVGWALGQGTPLVMIRFGEDPRGFPAKVQYPSGLHRAAEEVATQIAVWFTRDPTVGSRLIERIMAEVHNAGSYLDAKTAVERVEAMGKLSEPLLDELERAYLGNNQLHPHHVGTPVVERILRAHGRSMPAMGE